MTKIYFSDFFGIPTRLIVEYGAFDISLINDLPLFVDPFLLFASSKSEYQSLHDEIIRYMRFLRDAVQAGPIPRPLIGHWFTFPEVNQNWLGFTKTGNRGHGLGLKFASALHTSLGSTFADFGSETLTRSSHIEKLCLIQTGVGRDNISDFTVNLIQGFLAAYTEEFARTRLPECLRKRVAISRSRFDYSTESWVPATYELPFLDGEYVLLTPRDILTKDDSWISRSDLLNRLVDIADALPDATLRAKLNRYLARSLPDKSEASAGEVREVLAGAVEAFPAILDYYIKDREDKGDRAIGIADARVCEAQSRFVDQVRLLAGNLAETDFYSLSANTHEEARKRLEFLRDVIENKGGHRLLYVDGRPVEREKDLHILYRLTWYATPSDVNHEVNDGRGPADFKISRGVSDKTLVEFKLASNSKLERNLRNQTAVYEAASDATWPSLKAIFIFSKAQEKRVLGILERLGLEGDPNIVLVDARSDNKPSGSMA